MLEQLFSLTHGSEVARDVELQCVSISATCAVAYLVKYVNQGASVAEDIGVCFPKKK